MLELHYGQQSFVNGDAVLSFARNRSVNNNMIGSRSTVRVRLTRPALNRSSISVSELRCFGVGLLANREPRTAYAPDEAPARTATNRQGLREASVLAFAGTCSCLRTAVSLGRPSRALLGCG